MNNRLATAVRRKSKCESICQDRNYHNYQEKREPEQGNHRTDTPERLVNIRAVMFIDASSWNRSLAAYGICTCEMRCLLLHSRHSNNPFFSFLQERRG